MESQLDRRFDRMFRDYQRAIVVYFLRRTDRVTARDATADTFLVAWRRMEEMPPDEEVLPWLYGIARRVLANYRRSNKRFIALVKKLAGLSTAPAPTPETVVIRRDEEKQMLLAIERLEPKDREVLRLARWEGLTHAEIGAMFGTSPHAIDQRLHSITRRLADDIGRPRIRRPRVTTTPTTRRGEAQ